MIEVLPLALAAISGTSPPSTIASVRVEAATAEQADEARSYIEAAVGSPLDRGVVTGDVERLFATGAFQDVVVRDEALPGGVALIYRLSPAPLLSTIGVEGDAVLRPKDVARIARLRSREALWPARLDAAAQSVALALVAKGYLEARVRAEARRNGLETRAVFTIVAGPLARVRRVRLEGTTAGQAALLELMLRPAAGETFRRPEARKAAERMKAHLVSLGFWKARVDVEESYDPAAAGVDLLFRVRSDTLYSVDFKGVPPPQGLRHEIESLLRDGALSLDVLEEARDRIEEDLRRRGHRDAFVSRREEERPGGEIVVYLSEPGPEAQVSRVVVDGIDAARLLPLLDTRAGDPLVDRVVEEDAARLRRNLQDDGYTECRVEADVPDGGGPIPVVFHVRPGPRTLLRQVDVVVTGPSVDLPELRSKAGQPYSLRTLARDREALQDACRDAGFLGAEVSPEVRLSEDHTEAHAVLEVTPGARTTVDRVIVAGLEATDPEVVRRELTLKEGDPLGSADLLESQRRLTALGIFERVGITALDPEGGRSSIVVTLDEAPRTTVTYGIGAGERDIARGSIEVARRNLFGKGRSLSAFARGSFKGSRVLATYQEPYLVGSKLDLLVTAFREEEDRESFDFVRYGGLLQTAVRIAPKTGLILRFSNQKTHVFNVEVPLDEVDRQFRNSTSAGPSLSLVQDTRDDPLEPGRGRFVGADLQLSDPVFGGDSFVKSYFQAAAYRRIHPRLLMALSARLGLAWTIREGEPDLLPLPDRFFAGGDNTLRGFELDHVGPLETSESGEAVPTGGNALVLGNAELRFDAGSHFQLAVFSDSGNVYPRVSDLTLGDVRLTAGVGVRYLTAVGPLRVDWGYKLNRRPGETPGQFHFTIGHAF
jgi:outer membrane protein insertion porin family